MKNTCSVDVIIIGGGVAGIGCAAMLSESASVVVLEMESQCGYHASGRSAAIYLPSYGGPEIRQLTEQSEQYFMAPPDYFDDYPLLTKRGELLIAGEKECEALETTVAKMPGQLMVSAAECVEMVPILKKQQIKSASYEPDARDIDVSLLLQGWSRQCRGSGANIRTGEAVTSLRYTDSVWIATTGNSSYQAPVVVNAAGAWADQIAAMAGCKQAQLSPCRRSAAVIAGPTQYNINEWPLFAPFDESWYAKPFGGKLMISPADEDPVEPHDAFAEDLTLAEGLDRYQQAVSAVFTRVEHSWAGLRTFAPDSVPVVGYAPTQPGFFWLAGHGGYGIQTSPALSQLAANLIVSATLSTSDAALAAALSPNRLAK